MKLTTRIKVGILALLLGFVLVAGSFIAATSPVYATGSPTTITKYNTEFTYHGSGVWDVKNTDNNTELKNIGPTQSVLCSNNHAGGAASCVLNTVYTFTSDATNNGQNCAYIQGDGGSIGYSWDTVPGDATKRVCADEPSTPTVTPTPTTTPYPYEVTACWKMTNPDYVVGTYEFPQTYYKVDCSDLPEFACEKAEYQFDKYWIRDDADKDHFADIKSSGLGSAADDNSLEPHGYYSVVVKEKTDLCPSTPPTPTATVTVTPPVPTATVTETAPVPPTATVTETVTPPVATETVTVTPPPSTVTEPVTAPPVTTTETVTAPPVTATATVTETPTTTVTETVTGSPVTETATATATATKTVTITDKETQTVTKHDNQTVYSFDELPNTGAGQAVLAVFVIGIAAVLLGLWLLIRRK